MPASPRISTVNDDTGKLEPAGGVRLHVERWTSEDREFEVETTEPVTLAVRVLDYPAWQVHMDGALVGAEEEPTTAEMLVAVPVGKHQVDADFRRTHDRTAGGTISALSAVGLLGFAWVFRKREYRSGAGATAMGDA